jgi:hypothetical protein
MCHKADGKPSPMLRAFRATDYLVSELWSRTLRQKLELLWDEGVREIIIVYLLQDKGGK